jgi:hypothetical protein
MKSHLSLFVALLATTLAAEASAPTGRAKCILEGHVIQEPGARPIRKANIELASDDREDGTSYTAVTDAGGHFKIDNIEPGRYTLSVQHSGFQVSVNTAGGDPSRLTPAKN